LVNIHHFVLDGAIWKLRDSRIASLLLGGQSKTSESGATAWWIAGSSPVARATRIGLVGVLLLWAAVDQAHFYLASRGENLGSLRRAAAWNPTDSAVQLRLARAEESSGDRGSALQSLARAAQINPQNVVLHETYARALLQSGRSDG